MQKDSPRWRLREHTADAHAALDDLVGHFGSDCSYRRYLVATAAFRLPVEDWLATIRLPTADYRPSMIAADILADLGDLGLATPPLVAFPTNLSLDEVLGALYVLEGSALGAQILVKRAAALGFDGGHGARHLERQTASLDGWRNYLKLLDESEPFDIDVCIAAAKETFAAARHAFEAQAYA